MKTLFSGFPARLKEELTEILLESPAIHIERIVSHGHASLEGFWYELWTDPPGQRMVAMIEG